MPLPVLILTSIRPIFLPLFTDTLAHTTTEPEGTTQMGTENAELMRNAYESLRGKWWLAIGTFIAYYIIVGVLDYIPTIGDIVLLIITGPMMLGLSIFSLSIGRDEYTNVSMLFEGFYTFGSALLAYLLIVVFVVLWTLLLIVPGVIAALSYSMTFYILADDTSVAPMDALRKSKMMMDGFKLKLFRMFLRFFGLGLLCILTLGIGFLWLIPYANVCLANFYDDVNGPAKRRIELEIEQAPIMS